MNTEEHAHARSSDPITSHLSARSVTELTAKQTAVLDAFKSCLPDKLTDEELIIRYSELHAGFQDLYPRQSDSGLRTRRSELVTKGRLKDSGHRSKTKAGRSTIVWVLV
jgi:hypothetical protein